MAAAVATESPVDNPEPVTRERVRALLQRAWRGELPPPCYRLGLVTDLPAFGPGSQTRLLQSL